MLVRQLNDEILAGVLLNRSSFRCLDRQLRQFAVLDLLLKRRKIDVRGVLGAWIDELVDEQRASDNEQPKNDLSCGRTQNLHASVAHDSVNRLPLSLLTLPPRLQTL